MTDYMRPLMWAAYHQRGNPSPFINEYAVHRTRAEVMESIGGSWKMGPHETDRQGWKRAYRDGWRTVRVRIEPIGVLLP